MKAVILSAILIFIVFSTSYAEEPELQQFVHPETSLDWMSENVPQEIMVSDLIDIIFKNGYFLGLPGKIDEARERQRNGYQGMCNGMILYLSEKIYTQKTTYNKFGYIEVVEEEINLSDILSVREITIIYCGKPQKSITKTRIVPKDDPAIIYK